MAGFAGAEAAVEGVLEGGGRYGLDAGIDEEVGGIAPCPGGVAVADAMAVGFDIVEKGVVGGPEPGMSVVIGGAGAAIVGDDDGKEGVGRLLDHGDAPGSPGKGLAKGIEAGIDDEVVEDVAGGTST